MKKFPINFAFKKTAKNFFRKNSSVGLTLVEILLATMMVGLVFVALSSMLINGIKVWTFVNQESPEIDLNISVEKLGMDLKNTYYAKDIAFSGNAGDLKFPGLVPNQIRDNGFGEIPGRVRYYYDDKTRTLRQEHADLSALFTGKIYSDRELVRDVLGVSFSYYFYDQKKQKFFWINEWPPQEYDGSNKTMPLAVRLELSYQEAGGVKTMTKTFGIIAGGLNALSE